MLMLKQIILPIEMLIYTIMEKYLLTSYCVTIISEESLYLKFPSNYMYIFPKSNGVNDTLLFQMLDASEAGCSDYIVQITKPRRFVSVLDQIVHLGNIRRSDRKIIILPIPDITSKENNNELLEILNMRETSFIANVLLILANNETDNCTSYDLVTHKYVGTDNTEQPLYLDRWDSCTNDFDKKENLFPHDMTNLQGKEVKVAAFTYKPYVLLDLDPNLAPLGRDGMEMRIVDEFCRWVNCTVKIIRDDDHEWGEIYENLTGVGVIGNVFNDRADIGITALYSWFEEYVVMDFSSPIIRTAITCIAPSPRLLASWEMPLLPFSLYMWIGIFLTFLYASLALFIAQGFSGHNVFFKTFGIMVTQSQPDTTSWRIRSVMGWMMLTGLVLDNAYSGGLAATFTVPRYEKSVDTIQDIVDRQLEWGATHDAWIYSITLSQEPLIKELVGLFHTYPAEELKRKSFTRSMAFSIEKLPAGYFAIGEYIKKEASLDFTIMLENFYYEQCVVMLRKSSPYTKKISDFVGRLHQSGLILSWETQVALKYLDYGVQLEVKLSRSKHDVETIEPLSFRHVVGIFFIYIVGVGAALLAFISEIIIRGKMTDDTSSTQTLE